MDDTDDLIYFLLLVKVSTPCGICDVAQNEHPNLSVAAGSEYKSASIPESQAYNFWYKEGLFIYDTEQLVN